MPDLETMDLWDYAVLLQVSLINGYPQYGNDGVALYDPSFVELNIRFTRKRGQVVDKDGNRVGIDATAVVTQDITPDSRLWIGKLSDFQVQVPRTATALGSDSTEFLKVVTTEEAKDIKGNILRRIVTLKRFMGILPLTANPFGQDWQDSVLPQVQTIPWNSFAFIDDGVGGGPWLH